MAIRGWMRGERKDAMPAEMAATAGANQEIARSSLFDALSVPDYRRLWIGSLVSNIGTWMQLVGSGWLVLQLTNSPFWLGVESFAAAAPILAFSLPAGVVADRVDRRRLLLALQAATAVLALLLTVLALLGVVRLWHVLGITLLTGACQAFTMPAWQAMIPDLVGKDRLMNAVGLNSAAYNGAAVVGPSIAGLVIGAFGVAACFGLNAASYLAVIGALLTIRTDCKGAECRRNVNVLESVIEGLRFIGRRRVVFALFALAAVVSLAARPYLQLLPVFARDVLRGDSRVYGLLMAANGAGALAGSLLTAVLARIPRKGLVLLGSVATLSIALFAFALIPQLYVAFVLLIIVGGATTLYMSATNTVLQTLAPDEVRGRVLSVWSMIGAGVMPLGSLLLGGLATATGHVTIVVASGAAVALLAALVVAVVYRDPRRDRKPETT